MVRGVCARNYGCMPVPAGDSSRADQRVRFSAPFLGGNS